MIADDIIHGHIWLSDLLLLIAVIVFVVEALALIIGGRLTVTRGVLPAVGLACVACALLVL